MNNSKDLNRAHFTSFVKGNNWVAGKVGKYNFEAKLFDEGSSYGIENGRISKLSIWDEKVRQEKQNFLKACIVNYDRGWDIEPKSSDKSCYDAVISLLENAPKLFS